MNAETETPFLGFHHNFTSLSPGKVYGLALDGMLKNLERAKALRGAILAAPRGVESYESNLGYKWDPFMGGGGVDQTLRIQVSAGMSFNFGIFWDYIICI